MSGWVFVFVPLLVLPIIILFRFIGCGIDVVGQAAVPAVPPKYREFILGEPDNPGLVLHPKFLPKGDDVLAYWRLVDLDPATFAVDEKGKFSGTYRKSTDTDVTPGDFVIGQSSLISSDPKVMCRFFNGGYVLVPFKDGLYMEEFTIEAWIRPGFASGAEHTLFHAGGHYRAPFELNAEYHGFRIYATSDRRWQVALSGRNVFSSPPFIPQGDVRSHLAVTVQNLILGVIGKKKVIVFINGKSAQEASTDFFYSRPEGAPLLIGISGGESEPRDLETRAQPDVANSIRSTIQEVVLHRKALPQQEIENHVNINRRILI